MWLEYIGKTLLVKELDEDRGYGDAPISLMVLKVCQCELNEMALVSSKRGDLFWTFCSKYTVLLVEEQSTPESEWYQYIGHNLLVDDGSGILLEVIPLQVRGTACLGKFNWMGHADETCRWFNVSDYIIRNPVF